MIACLLISSFAWWTSVSEVQASGAKPGKPAQVAPYSSGLNDSISSEPEKDPDLVKNSLLDRREDVEFSKCGQDCLYLKQKENMTLQIQYIVKKREDAPGLLLTYSDEEKKKILGSYCDEHQLPDLRACSRDYVEQLLGRFCLENEGLNNCTRRYQEVTKFWLVKARGALAALETSIQKLRSGDKETATLGIEVDPKAKKLQTLPNVGYVMTSSELKKFAVAAESLKNVTWSDERVWDELKPTPEDFVKVVQVETPEGKEEQADLEEESFSPNGKGDLKYRLKAKNYDQVAYEASLKHWEAQKKAHLIFGAGEDEKGNIVQARSQKELEKLSQDELSQRAGRGANGKQQADQGGGGAGKGGKDASLRTFEAARGHYVDEMNQVAADSGWQKDQSFPGKKGDASKKKAGKLVSQKPKGDPHKEYTGEEQVVIPKDKGGKGDQTNREVTSTLNAGTLRPYSLSSPSPSGSPSHSPPFSAPSSPPSLQKDETPEPEGYPISFP